MGKTDELERMNHVKHTHGEMLFTDAVDYMQWVETLSDGRLFTVMGVGKPDGARNNTTVSQFLFGRISEDGEKLGEHRIFSLLGRTARRRIACRGGNPIGRDVSMYLRRRSRNTTWRICLVLTCRGILLTCVSIAFAVKILFIRRFLRFLAIQAR